MRVYAISHMVSSPKGQRSYRATWPYHVFYHEGAGPGIARAVVNRYGERPYKPLPISRNLRLMPKVFFQSIDLVVATDVARELTRFNGVDLVPCEWDLIYDWPVDEAAVRDMLSRYSVFEDDSYDGWQRQVMKPPPPGFPPPDYFEVLGPRHAALRNEFECMTSFKLPDPLDERQPPLVTCAALHERCPLTKSWPHTICSEPVFAILEPHVRDPDLFTVVPFDVE